MNNGEKMTEKKLQGRSLNVAGVNLNNLISMSKHNYLEIGCFDGYNLALLAEAFENRKIFGIDPFISDQHLGMPIGTKLLKQKENLYHNISYYKNINFFETTAEDFLKNNLEKLKDYNISSIFIDGAHIIDFIKIDVDLSIECIKNNNSKSGAIAFDDLHIPDVLQGIEYFKNKCIEKEIKFFQETPHLFRIEFNK
jgi:hypothetical protein